MNESETAILAGPEHAPQSQETSILLPLAKKFLDWGVRDTVIITLGSNGLVYATRSGASGHLKAFPAKVVDTTAAGDTFVGGYAVQRVRNLEERKAFDYGQALEFATWAASKTVERQGAMAAIPFLHELQVEALRGRGTIAAGKMRK